MSQQSQENDRVVGSQPGGDGQNRSNPRPSDGNQPNSDGQNRSNPRPSDDSQPDDGQKRGNTRPSDNNQPGDGGQNRSNAHPADANQMRRNPRAFINSRENWLKGNLALLCTKDGLKEFVETEIIAMHGAILTDLYKHIPPGTTCSQCTTANLTRCSNSGACGKNCSIHKQTDPKKCYRPCPNKACNEFMNQITMCHRYGPTWQNTDATQWFSSPWEIAKCFLPHGSLSSSSANDADLPELLNIIINNSRFEQKLKENMKNEKNIYCRARTVRNEVFHSGSGAVSEHQLHDIMALLIKVLSDGQCLANNATAKGAVGELIRLRDESLVISREEAEKIEQEAQLQYQADKIRLQHHLGTQYLNLCWKVPISHLVSELAADLDDVCAPQSLRQVKLPHETDHEGRNQQLPAVESYTDVFLRGPQRCRNIYIKGDAGSGKSFFCQKMVQAWSKHIISNCIEADQDFMKKFAFLFYIPLKHVPSENDLDEMIFSHPLLQCKDHKDLIKKLLQEESDQCLIILDGLDEWSPTQNTAHMFISKGLPLRDVTRRCTIVTTTRPWKLEAVRMKSTEIDQLIELTGLDVQASEQYIESLVKCLNERFGLDKSAKDFISVLQANNLYPSDRYIVFTDNLSTVISILVIVKGLVCSWHADKPIGNSLCEIYSGMLDFLLQLPEKELIHWKKDLESVKQTSPSDKLPPCFDKYPNCREFGQMLTSLSRLSFYTLFDAKRESSLVFDSSITGKHGMSEGEMKACLSVGILSQDIVMQQAAFREHKLSFLHKTFQEFLAAVYISLFHDKADDVLMKVCKICSSVEMVLEMEKVFVFLSGMCPSVMSRLSDHIAAVVTADEKVQAYRNTVDCNYWNTVDCNYLVVCVGVQSLMLDCMKEAACNGVSEHLNIYIQDVIIEKYRQTPEITPLIQSSNGHIKSVYIEDHTYLGMLQYITHTGVIEKLALKGDWNSELPLSSLSSIIHQNRASLRCLDLYQIECTDISVETLSELFEGLSYLEAIRLGVATLSHEQYVWLVAYLCHKTELRQVSLSSLKCAECGASHGSLDLTSHDQLNTLKLSKLQIHTLHLPTHCPQLSTLELSELHVDHIQLPTHCPQLNTLQLSWLHVDHIKLPPDITHLQLCIHRNTNTPVSTVSVLKMLRHSPQLHTLWVMPRDDEMQEVGDTVLSVLPTLHNIRHITLWRLPIGNRELTLSPLMTHLKCVYLYDVTMCRESVHSLVNSLLQIQHSVWVGLDYITITPADDADSVLDIVRSSDRCVVKRDVKTTDSEDLYTDTDTDTDTDNDTDEDRSSDRSVVTYDYKTINIRAKYTLRFNTIVQTKHNT